MGEIAGGQSDENKNERNEEDGPSHPATDGALVVFDGGENFFGLDRLLFKIISFLESGWPW
jgi:hypothetical protein